MHGGETDTSTIRNWISTTSCRELGGPTNRPRDRGNKTIGLGANFEISGCCKQASNACSGSGGAVLHLDLQLAFCHTADGTESATRSLHRKKPNKEMRACSSALLCRWRLMYSFVAPCGIQIRVSGPTLESPLPSPRFSFAVEAQKGQRRPRILQTAWDDGGAARLSISLPFRFSAVHESQGT